MNNIGFGIFCFGEKKYFHFTESILDTLIRYNIKCYVLTDDVEFFKGYDVTTLPYDRQIKSYHDKVLLHKKILKNYKISITIDADTLIFDESFIEDLLNYNFNKGVSYVETLESHPINKKRFSELSINEDSIEWNGYIDYLKNVFPDYSDIELIWEYFLVINQEDFNYEEFFTFYEKLQIVKEYCDTLRNKNKIIGAAEGVSLYVASKLSNNQIQHDTILNDIIKNKIKPITRYS